MSDYTCSFLIKSYALATCRQNDGGYVAFYAELQSVIGRGSTPDEAQDSLTEAVEMTKEHFRLNGLRFPPPMGFDAALSAIDWRDWLKGA